ncbi:MAG TPA: helix-turn-helix domain-containing protein [Syntrophales bacterium]|nr:helix-turn-helix domain-containing protein [Syntrophales bacterium]
MLIIEGETYFTISDAAKIFGVSTKTVRSYINNGIIPDPPEVQYGLRTLKHFPPEYMEKAKKSLDTYRQKNVPLKDKR